MNNTGVFSEKKHKPSLTFSPPRPAPPPPSALSPRRRHLPPVVTPSGAALLAGGSGHPGEGEGCKPLPQPGEKRGGGDSDGHEAGDSGAGTSAASTGCSGATAWKGRGGRRVDHRRQHWIQALASRLR